jgi:hypothetical protein
VPSEYEHEEDAWVREAVWPAIVNVAVRVTPVLFTVTPTETKPDPEPDAPLATVAHGWSLVAVQAQPLGATTE